MKNQKKKKQRERKKWFYLSCSWNRTICWDNGNFLQQKKHLTYGQSQNWLKDQNLEKDGSIINLWLPSHLIRIQKVASLTAWLSIANLVAPLLTPKGTWAFTIKRGKKVDIWIKKNKWLKLTTRSKGLWQLQSLISYNLSNNSHADPPVTYQPILNIQSSQLQFSFPRNSEDLTIAMCCNRFCTQRG